MASRSHIEKDKDLIMVLFVDPESGDGEKGPFQTISGAETARPLLDILSPNGTAPDGFEGR
jgi:hypothetical protein